MAARPANTYRSRRRNYCRSTHSLRHWSEWRRANADARLALREQLAAEECQVMAAAAALAHKAGGEAWQMRKAAMAAYRSLIARRRNAEAQRLRLQ